MQGHLDFRIAHLFGHIIYPAKDFWEKCCSVPSNQCDTFAVAFSMSEH